MTFPQGRPDHSPVMIIPTSIRTTGSRTTRRNRGTVLNRVAGTILAAAVDCQIGSAARTHEPEDRGAALLSGIQPRAMKLIPITTTTAPRILRSGSFSLNSHQANSAPMTMEDSRAGATSATEVKVIA